MAEFEEEQREHHHEEHDLDRILHELHEIRGELHELAEIKALLAAILAALTPPAPGQPASGTITFEGGILSQINVTDASGPQLATASYVDAEGNGPATPQSPPVWASDNEAVATVDASQDPSGLTAVVTPVGIGTANITATTENNDGSSAVATGSVVDEAGQPASGDISFAPVQ